MAANYIMKQAMKLILPKKLQTYFLAFGAGMSLMAWTFADYEAKQFP